ncbi:hypothetical protein PINS_up022328 [Pythium insidiosum]|nr:hypothetical protein PINS_up022328 [Pythium insidiosum]
MEYDGSTTESECYEEPETLSDVETTGTRMTSTPAEITATATAVDDALDALDATRSTPTSTAATTDAASRKRVRGDSETQVAPAPKQARGDTVQPSDVAVAEHQQQAASVASGDASRPCRPASRKCRNCSGEVLEMHIHRRRAKVPHWRCTCCQEDLVKAAFGRKPPRSTKPKCMACIAAPPTEKTRHQRQTPVPHVEPVDPQTLEELRRTVADANRLLATEEKNIPEGDAVCDTLRKRFHKLQELRNNLHIDGKFLGECEELSESMRQEIVMSARHLDRCELNLLTREARVCAALHVTLGRAVPLELQRVLSADSTSGNWVANALQPKVADFHPRMRPETREFLRDYRCAARQKLLVVDHLKWAEQAADPEKLRVLRDVSERAVDLLTPHLIEPTREAASTDDVAPGGIPTPPVLAQLRTRCRQIDALRLETNPDDVLSRDGGELSAETRDEARVEWKRLDVVEAHLRTRQVLVCAVLLKQHGHAVPSDVERVVVEHATGNWMADVLEQKVMKVGVGLTGPAQAELKAYKRRLRLLKQAEAAPETEPQQLQKLREIANEAEELVKAQRFIDIDAAPDTRGAPHSVFSAMKTSLEFIHKCRSLIYAGDTFLGDCPELSDAVRREVRAERRRLDRLEVMFLVRLILSCAAQLRRCGQVLPPTLQRIVDENATENWEQEALARGKVSRVSSQLTDHAQSVLSARRKEYELKMAQGLTPGTGVTDSIDSAA